MRWMNDWTRPPEWAFPTDRGTPATWDSQTGPSEACPLPDAEAGVWTQHGSWQSWAPSEAYLLWELALRGEWRAAAWTKRLPARFQGAALDDFPDVKGAVVDWIVAPPPRGNLLLLGPVGTGKTRLAYAIGLEVVRSITGRVEVASVPALLDRLRPGDHDDKEHDPVEFLADVPLLILDDLGAEKATEWTAERLDVIVDQRWQECRPTIVTSNMLPDDLSEHSGARLWDRLRDGATAIRLSGDSHRRPA